MLRPTSLDMFYERERVGSVHDTSPITFEYTASWLARTEPFAVSGLPLGPGRQTGPGVTAFFENLLPEGELRAYLTQQKKASSLFSLLAEVAGDTAGAFVLLPTGQLPQPPSYEATTWEALAQQIAAASASAIDIRGRDARISLAGAQDKASIAIFDDGIPRLPQGTSPSTHILKPDIRRLQKVWSSAANECIVMRTAAHCGLPTAPVFYEQYTQACVVERFDRLPQPNGGGLARLVQYDLCQLSGTASERKYEKEGGPGVAACALLIRRYSTQAAVDLRCFLLWVLFNLYTGNNDSHAKNLSLYWLPARGVALTPFYDLMCTRLYPGLSPEFAFALGGEVMPGNLTRVHLDAMARELGVQPVFVSRLAADLAKKLPEALAQAIRELGPAFNPPAVTLAQRLEQFVRSTTRSTASRLLEA